MTSDYLPKRPAAERNSGVILNLLKDILPPTGTVLEISSGTGQHAAYFSSALAPRFWQPSEFDPALINTIDMWRNHSNSDFFLSPIILDVCRKVWPIEKTKPNAPITSIVNINMIHIAPWEACLGLLAGAGRVLKKDGILYIYGPFKRGHKHNSLGNKKFDLSLKEKNSSWGIRNIEDIEKAAMNNNLLLEKIEKMPVNNKSLVFRKLR